ncbi:unnamed protein product [Pylaiella littoralis]
MFLTFYGYYELWSLFCTTLLSLFLMVYLILVKFNLERSPARHTTMVAMEGFGDPKGDHGVRSKHSLQRAAADGAQSASDAASNATDISTEVQPLMSSW